jgi:hypothetical protein
MGGRLDVPHCVGVARCPDGSRPRPGTAAIELTLIVDQDSLTVFVPGSAPIALGDFAFAPNEDDRYPLQAYGAFRGKTARA